MKINQLKLIWVSLLLLFSVGSVIAQPSCMTIKTVQNPSFCAGDDVVFAMDVPGPNSQYIQDAFNDGGSLWWKIQDGNGNILYLNGSQSTANLTFNFGTGGTYMISLTLHAGAGSNSPIITNPCPLTITINDSWASSDFMITGVNCSNYTVTVNPNVAFNSTPVQWSFSPAVNVTTTGTIPGVITHTFPSAGTYDITLTIWPTTCVGGAGTSYTTTKQVVIPNCPGGNVELDCSSETMFCPDIGITSFFAWFEWILPNGTSITQHTRPCIVPTECGTYTLLVHDFSTSTYVYEIDRVPTNAGEIVPSGPAVPGEALSLTLDNYSGDVAYIAWEFQVNSCANVAPQWVGMTAGAQPIANFETFDLNAATTSAIFTKCTMADDFTFCFRAKVYCQNPLQYPDCGYKLVEKCVPICIDDTERGGGGLGPIGTNPDRVADAIRPELNVYPNPASGYTVLEVDAASANQNVFVQLTDMQGKIVKRIKLNTDLGGSFKHKLDVHSLPTGVYAISIQIGEVQLHDMLVKQ